MHFVKTALTEERLIFYYQCIVAPGMIQFECCSSEGITEDSLNQNTENTVCFHLQPDSCAI